jgi:hypothetical protein
MARPRVEVVVANCPLVACLLIEGVIKGVITIKRVGAGSYSAMDGKNFACASLEVIDLLEDSVIHRSESGDYESFVTRRRIAVDHTPDNICKRRLLDSCTNPPASFKPSMNSRVTSPTDF